MLFCADHSSGTQYPLIKIEGIVPISYHGVLHLSAPCVPLDLLCRQLVQHPRRHVGATGVSRAAADGVCRTHSHHGGAAQQARGCSGAGLSLVPQPVGHGV